MGVSTIFLTALNSTTKAKRPIVLDRMQTGPLQGLQTLTRLVEEFRLYHRKDGRVHKEADDLMAATRYGVMMLRFAEIVNRAARKRSTLRPADGWARDRVAGIISRG
jgi:hypothetical protein